MKPRTRQIPVLVAIPIALVLLTPSPGSAQLLQSFQDLPLRVNLHERLRIEDQSGARSTGRLIRLTPDEIAIQTDAGEKRLSSGIVREVAVRRNSHRKGVLIGAGVGVVLGALAACVGADRSECADGPVILGALGAGVGLAVSSLITRTTTLYRPPIDRAPSRESLRPAGPFDDLALRVNLDDHVRVKDASGAGTTGRLTRLTGDEMAIETDAGEKRFTSATVREVAVRSYKFGMGALIGAGVFTAVVAVAPACRANSDCIPIAAAPVGAGVGLAVGALIPRMTTVFRAQEKRASFSPEFSRGGIGVRASLRW